MDRPNYQKALAEHIAAVRMVSDWFKAHPNALASELPHSLLERLKRAQADYNRAKQLGPDIDCD